MAKAISTVPVDYRPIARQSLKDGLKGEKDWVFLEELQFFVESAKCLGNTTERCILPICVTTNREEGDA